MIPSPATRDYRCTFYWLLHLQVLNQTSLSPVNCRERQPRTWGFPLPARMFSRDVGARDRSNVAERKIQSMGAENTQRLFSTLITLDQQKSCFVSVLVKTFFGLLWLSWTSQRPVSSAVMVQTLPTVKPVEELSCPCAGPRFILSAGWVFVVSGLSTAKPVGELLSYGLIKVLSCLIFNGLSSVQVHVLSPVLVQGVSFVVVHILSPLLVHILNSVLVHVLPLCLFKFSAMCWSMLCPLIWFRVCSLSRFTLCPQCGSVLVLLLCFLLPYCVFSYMVLSYSVLSYLVCLFLVFFLFCIIWFCLTCFCLISLCLFVWM